MHVRTYAYFLLPCLFILPSILIAVAVFEGHGINPTSYYQLQTDLFININGWLSGWSWFWKNVTELGDALVFFPLLAFLIFRSPQTWAALFGAIPLSGILSRVGKNLAAVPRPAAVLDHSQFNIVGKVLAGHTSLPSGHTITATAIITVLVCSMIGIQQTQTRKAWLLIGGVIIGSMIGLSRVAVGAHWPMDVLIGACIGIAGGGSGLLLAQRYKAWWAWVETPRGHAIFGFIMLLWGGSLIQKTLSIGDNELVVPWVAACSAIAVSLYLAYLALLPRFRSGKSQNQ